MTVRVAFCLRDMNIGGVESVLTRTLDRLCKNTEIKIVVCLYTPVRVVWREWFASHPEIELRVIYPHMGTDLPRGFLWRVLQHGVRDIYRAIRRMFVVPRMLRDIDVFIDYYDFDWWHELRRIHKPKIAWWHSSVKKFMHGHYIKRVTGYYKFVVLTDAFADVIRHTYPDISTRVIRIYNPIDIAVARDNATRVPRRDGDYFVCVARLVNGKDIETVIHAFDMFWQKNNQPDTDLLIVGDGYARPRFDAFAQRVLAKKHIIFTGAVDNPFGFIAGARANILSSHGEGFALVLIEAAAVGTLNIASDCEFGPREILMDGNAGILFNVGDADALAAAMDAVYNNTIDTDKMVKRATENLNRFDIKQINKIIQDLVLTARINE
ncbi:MAG: glycosyltransferase [Alphaproteobacteria bacterium]|nr:glycosyltransferase [Alphaproteobacteria bacterium]